MCLHVIDVLCWNSCTLGNSWAFKQPSGLELPSSLGYLIWSFYYLFKIFLLLLLKSNCLFLFWLHGVMFSALDSKRLNTYLCFMNMSICLPVCMCITCGHVANRGPKMALDILQTTASHCVGARTELLFSRPLSALNC